MGRIAQLGRSFWKIVGQARLKRNEKERALSSTGLGIRNGMKTIELSNDIEKIELRVSNGIIDSR